MHAAEDILDALSLVQAGRMLLDDYANWTQDSAARDSTGFPVDSRSESACEFCAIGSIMTFVPHSNMVPDLVWSALGDVVRKIVPTGIAAFNDNHTHKEVLAVFDAAIEDLALQHSLAEADSQG